MTVALRWTSHRAEACAVKRFEILSVDRLHQSGRHLNDVDLDPEAREHMGQLDRDIAAAQNDHAGGQGVETHDGVRGLERNPRLRHDRRDQRAATRGDHDLLRSDADLIIDHQFVGTCEASTALEHGYICRLDPALTPCERGLVQPRADPVPDRRPVDLVECRRQAELRGAADLHRQIRGVDKHLGRDTTPIEARPPEATALDERHPAPTDVIRDDHVAGTGADDRQRKLFHRPSLRVTRSRPQARASQTRRGTVPALRDLSGKRPLGPIRAVATAPTRDNAPKAEAVPHGDCLW